MSLSLKQQLNSNATDLNDVTQRVTVSELATNVLKTRMTATENKAITQGNQINSALVSITNNAGQINAVNAAKQDKIRTTSEITMDKLNINTHIINNGNFLQKGAVYFNNGSAFNSEVDLVVQTGSTVTARIASSGAISGQSLSYRDGSEIVDVKTKINQMTGNIQTLDDKLTGTITILSEDGGSYKLDEMLDIIVANKVKLDTFVQLAIDGSTGDTDPGSVSLIEAVAQNKADIFTTTTAVTNEATERLTQDNIIKSSISIANTRMDVIEESITVESQNRVADVARNYNKILENKTLIESEVVSRSTADNELLVKITEVDDLVAPLLTLPHDLQLETNARVAGDDATEFKLNIIAANLVSEVNNRQSGDAENHNNIFSVAETVTIETNARVAADTLLTNTLSTVSTALTAETQARTAADTSIQQSVDDNYVELDEVRTLVKSTAFSNVMEAEGILLVNDMPFSMGSGSPSRPGFGLSVPFNYKVVAYSIICNSTDTNPNVSFSLRNYKNGSTTDYTEFASYIVMGSTKYKKQLQVPSAVPQFFSEQEPGNLCIIVNSVSGCVDVNARYRFSLFLQSVWALG